MVVSRHQSARQNHTLLTANESSGNVTKFMYLGTTVTVQICIQEKLKAD
jgi:hypothetical protein